MERAREAFIDTSVRREEDHSQKIKLGGGEKSSE